MDHVTQFLRAGELRSPVSDVAGVTSLWFVSVTV